MKQVRYHNYRTPITSKGVSEPLSVVTGIGPKSGFTSASYANNTLTLLADTTDKDNINFISNTDKSITNVDHSVITPDGILTLFEGDIQIPVSGMGEFNEVLVVARHVYLAMESVSNATSLVAYPNKGKESVIPKLMEGRKPGTFCNMTIFKEVANSIHTLDVASEVIIGIYKLDGNNITCMVPRDYCWPRVVRVKDVYLNNLETVLSNHGLAITDLKSQIDTTNKTVSKQGEALAGRIDGAIGLINDTQDTVTKQGRDISTNKGDIRGLEVSKLDSIATYTINETLWGGNRGKTGIFVTGQFIQFHINCLVDKHSFTRQTMDIPFSLMKDALEHYSITQQDFFTIFESHKAMLGTATAGTASQLSADNATFNVYPVRFNVEHTDPASDYLSISALVSSNVVFDLSTNVNLVTTITIPLRICNII